MSTLNKSLENSKARSILVKEKVNKKMVKNLIKFSFGLIYVESKNINI